MGIIFISVGIVFLLNNFGVLSWMVWETLINFWPLMLIAAGLEVLAGKNLIFRMFVNLLILIGVGFLLIQVAMVDNENFQNKIKKDYRWFPYYEEFFKKDRPVKFQFKLDPGKFL